MSIVAAKIFREDKKVILASDTILLYGSDELKTDKLYEIKDKLFYIGVTGASTDAILIKYYLDMEFDYDSFLKNNNDELYLYMLFLKISQKIINDTTIVNGKERKLNFNILVYFNKKLYNIFVITDNEVSLEIISVDRDFYSIGRGCEYATCAMHLGQTPQEAILTAYEFGYYINNDIKTIEFTYD